MKKNKNRPFYERAVGNHYRRKFRWMERCVYCGDRATCLDHVFPISVAARLDLARPNVRHELGQGLSLVPSCKECNALAADEVFTSIREKRANIQAKLIERLNQLSKMPDWDDDEIEELGYTLRTSVEHFMAKKRKYQNRVRWPRRPQRAKSVR